MSEIVKYGRSKVFFDTFERRPGPIKKNMHYCPGCGHGILHKLIAEAVEKHGIQENTVLIAPVEAGEVLGFVTVTHDGEMLATVSLCAAEGVEASAFLAALNQISVYTESRFFLLSCGYAALLLFGYFVLLPYWRKRRNRKRAKYF